jgi:hypothetical protein
MTINFFLLELKKIIKYFKNNHNFSLSNYLELLRLTYFHLTFKLQYFKIVNVYKN